MKIDLTVFFTVCFIIISVHLCYVVARVFNKNQVVMFNLAFRRSRPVIEESSTRLFNTK